VVFLNTSGGMTGGDRLSFGLSLAAGCRVTATTQTAERAYRSADGPARVEIRHQVGPGAHLDWLPQETILFDHSALERRTVIELAADASCLALEAVVLGRAAMGEQVREVTLTDRRQVLREGRPVLVEPLRLSSAALGAGTGCCRARGPSPRWRWWGRGPRPPWDRCGRYWTSRGWKPGPRASTAS
jgi:urease accessory protein